MLVAGIPPSVLTHCAVTAPFAALTRQMALSTSSWRPVAKVNEFAADSGGERGAADRAHQDRLGATEGERLTGSDAAEVGVVGGPSCEVGRVADEAGDPAEEGEVRDTVL